MNIKIFTNNKSVRLFEGFTLQQGFIFGFIEGVTPFVCNGTIFSKYISVYFLNGGEWKSQKVGNSSPIYAKIAKTAEKNKFKIEKTYASALQIEEMHINRLRAEGRDTGLFSANGAVRKRDAKSRTKNITNYITEASRLQSKSI